MEQRQTVKYCIDRSFSKIDAAVVYAISGTKLLPIMYLNKPQRLTDEEFKSLIDKVRIQIEE